MRLFESSWTANGAGTSDPAKNPIPAKEVPVVPPLDAADFNQD
jgi:hypothetical protein